MIRPAYELPADPMTTPPTLSDRHGRAWRFTPADDMVPRELIDGWIIEAPWAHPAWHSYGILLMHLRGTPGEPPLAFYLPGATHEFSLFALDPKRPRQGMIDSGTLGILEPANFSAQLIAAADDLAMTEIYCAVNDIIRGHLSPDTDFVRAWVDRFGANMIRKEYRDG